MAIVLTNGEFYIKLAENGKVEKTNLMEDAEIFPSVNKAVEVIKRARKKTTNYYVYDTETRCICWKNYKRRKQYSRGTRELIYKQANGCCQLCGRKITYEQATLDHVIPLVMGGIDSVENLQLSALKSPHKITGISFQKRSLTVSQRYSCIRWKRNVETI